MKYSHIRKQHVYADHLFPPVFMVGKDDKTIEELQYSKVTLLVFKIFNSLTSDILLKYRTDKILLYQKTQETVKLDSYMVYSVW